MLFLVKVDISIHSCNRRDDGSCHGSDNGEDNNEKSAAQYDKTSHFHSCLHSAADCRNPLRRSLCVPKNLMMSLPSV